MSEEVNFDFKCEISSLNLMLKTINHFLGRQKSSFLEKKIWVKTKVATNMEWSLHGMGIESCPHLQTSIVGLSPHPHEKKISIFGTTNRKISTEISCTG